jgi:hypothetical protein
MRTEIAIISALALVLSVPVAFGEIVETKGQNYDLVENFFIGEAVWESHPERIMDGGWQNYALSNTGDKIIFNTNAVGSFVFDKNSCSYSIYGNGFDGEQVIPSVSAVATYLNNGQWQNLPINDEACTVTVDRYEDGVFLKSTKVITEDITEDVFIPYTGTTQNFYVNATNSQFTLVTNSTGNVGYFNGETRVLESVEVEKFVQEIDLNIHKGFKETFKVTHDGSEELGISQTIHTGESITIGDQTINIAELNGQSFDRQYLEDNQAQVFEIADSLNYDFDIGFQSLSNVNIIFDGDYKVNMDYASGYMGTEESVPFIGYLEIDPSFTTTATSNSYASSASFDVSSLPTPIAISSATAGHETLTSSQISSLESSSGSGSYSHTWTNSPQYTSTSAWSNFAVGYSGWTTTFLTDIHDSDLTTFGHFPCYPCGTSSAVFDTGAQADQTLFIKNALVVYNDNGSPNLTISTSNSQNSGYTTHTTRDFPASGYTVQGLEVTEIDGNFRYIKFNLDNTGYDSTWRVYWIGSSDISVTPELSLTYEVPIKPNAPTNLSTVTGIPIELDWDSPVTTVTPTASPDEDFSTDNWTDNDSTNIGVSSNSLNWNAKRDGSNDASTRDLGSSVSDNWLLRFKVDVTNVNTSTQAGNGFFVGLSDKPNTDGHTTSQDFIGVGIYNDNTDSYRTIDSDGAGLPYIYQGDSNQSTTYDTGSTWYYEIIKEGSSYTVEAFSNSDYSTGSEGKITGSSSASGLQYLKVLNDMQSIGTSTNPFQGTIDDLEFYDGVTSPDSYTTGDGNSAITGYKVFRTLNEFALTELPNNSANANGVDFTDNEFLIHGLETTTLASAIETHRDSNTWLSLGFKMADETTNSNNRYVDVSPTEESGTDPTLTIVADGTTYTLVATEDLAPRGDNGQGCASPSSGSILDSSAEWFAVTVYPTTTYNKCVRGMAEFDISSIPTSATITDATMTWKVDNNGLDSTDRIAVYVMDTQGTTLTSFTGLYQGITSGTLVSDTVEITGTGDKTFSVYDESVTTTIPDKSTNSISVTIGQTADTSNVLFDNLSDTTGGQSLFTGSDVLGVAQINSGSTLIGTTVFALEIPLFAQGSPTGEAIGGVFDSSGNLLHEFNRVDVSTLPTQSSVMTAPFPTFTFEGTTGYTLSSGENIGVKFEPTGTSNTSHRIFTRTGSSDNFDGSNTSYGARSVSGWTYQTTAFDFAFKLYGGGNASTSTTGVISTGVQNPDLSFTDSNLFDSTDDFSIGSWVKLDQGRDSTYDGTNNGATTGATGKIGNAWEFAQDYVSLPLDISNSLAGTDKVTYSLWFNTDEFSTSQGNGWDLIGSYGSTTGSNLADYQGLGINYWYDGNFYVYPEYHGGFSGNSHGGISNTNLGATATGTWYHMTVVYDGTQSSNADKLKIYLDGTQKTFDSFSGTVPSTISYGSVSNNWIGKPSYSTSYQHDFDGKIDEVVIYDKALTSTEVSALYNGGSGTTTPDTDGMVAHYNFEQTGTTLENQKTIPPANTKLLQLNDVTFSVDTDSANVVESSVNSPSYTSTSAYSWTSSANQANWSTYAIDQDQTTASIGTTHHGQSGTLTGNHIYDTGNTNSKTIEYNIGVTCTSSQCNNLITPQQNAYIDVSSGDLSSWTVDGAHTHLGVRDVETMYTGSFTTSERYIKVSTDGNCGARGAGFSYTTACEVGFLTNVYEVQIVDSNTIISATGLDDNTSSPQHYTFVRDGNDWEIYQNGVSEATNTDTTSLGSNAGTSGSESNTNVNDVAHFEQQVGANYVIGQQITSGNVLIGKQIDSLSFWLYKLNSGSSGTETFTFGIWDSSGNLQHNFGTVTRGEIPQGSYPTTGAQKFTESTGSYTLQTDDIIGVRTDTNPNNAWTVEITQRDSDVYSNGQRAVFTQGSTPATSTKDIGFEASYSSPAPYTTNISGMIDEYFIDSTALTSTEIDQVYENGKELTPIATTNGVTTDYDDNTVVGGNTYYYSVKSTNVVGDSDFLTPFVSGLAGTPADPPSSVSSTINSPNTAPLDITVSWSSPTNVGTGTLTGFEIYRDGVLIDTTGLVTSYPDTVPSGGGTFEYKLKSLSTHGTSGFSSTTSTTTPTVPPTPTSTVSLAIDNPNPSPLDIEISWTEPASGGSIITGYEIFRSATETGTYTSVGTVTDLDFTDTVPSAGTWYYTFSAVNLVGSSGQSPSNSITTASVPSSPLNASSVIPSINSAPYDVTVSWDLPTSTGGSALTGYNVYRQTGSGAFTLVDTTTALGVVNTVPSALNQDYTFKIHSLNNVGESTGFVTTTVTTGNVPDAPVLSFTTGTTALSWTVPSSDASITGYEIFRDGSSLTTITGTSHSDFTPINFGQSYQYEVQAVSSLGNSVDSNSIVTTPETEITGMIVQGITGTGAVIDWNEPAYYQGQITSYSVYYSTPAQSANPTTSAGTTTNTYSNFAPNLNYDTSYTFGVTVNSPLGNSGFSNLVNATTGIDNSIVAYDPAQGGMQWFDIDSVNEQTVNVIEFQRETQNIAVNGTFTDVDTLQVGYPSWWDSMTCDVDYKFAQKTEQYVEGEDMTAVVNSADANQQVIGFQFQDIDNEVIEVECAPQQSQQDDGVSAKYIMTQTNLATGMPSIPLVTQIQAFQTGDYGTDGSFGALDIVGLFVILISMVGFNRLSPIVGVLLSASMVFALSFFGIISLPTVLVGVIALVIFLGWGITRNR